MSISFNFNVVIDCTIEAPRHGKDLVDDINFCDKRYLMVKYL